MLKFIASLERRWTVVIVGSVGLLTLWTFAQRYPFDDAFISFRYAEHLVNGWGLVWNQGERIEGFTNFLWTLLIALGMKLGVSPERFAVILSAPCFIGALLLTYFIALRITSSRWIALTCLFLTGLTRSVYGLATSGMETTLQM